MRLSTLTRLTEREFRISETASSPRTMTWTKSIRLCQPSRTTCRTTTKLSRTLEPFGKAGRGVERTKMKSSKGGNRKGSNLLKRIKAKREEERKKLKESDNYYKSKCQFVCLKFNTKSHLVKNAFSYKYGSSL